MSTIKKVVITGGQGDIARSIKSELEMSGRYQVFAPSRTELDVTDTSSITRYFDSLVPDVLINNAGFIKLHALNEGELDDDKKTIDVIVTGTFLCSSVAVKKNPNIILINIGSSAGTNVRPLWSSYCAAKAAIIMATKCWFAEGIKVVCISPGRTKTKMRKALFPNESDDNLLEPKDLAKVVKKGVEELLPWGENINVNRGDFNGHK
jgi:NAD(P)-dependent dehydrogenase (short-subunit alcohol dehydrogenase family)